MKIAADARGRPELGQALGVCTSPKERSLEGLGLLAAADKRDVVGLDRKRRQQRGFVAPALRRDNHMTRRAFFDGELIAFDATINLGKCRLVLYRSASGHRKPGASRKLSDPSDAQS